MLRLALLALGGAHAIRLGAVVPTSRAVMRCRAPVMDAVSEMPVSLDALSEIQQTVAGQAVVRLRSTKCLRRWAAPRWDCRDAGGGGHRLAVRASRGLRRGADGVRRAHARAALGRCRGVMEW